MAWTEVDDGSTTSTSTTINVADANFTISDDSDATKQLKFSVGGITTATTRTLTAPDASDTIVTLAATQTLTNKTLTAPTLTNPSVTGTLTTTGSIQMDATGDSILFGTVGSIIPNASGTPGVTFRAQSSGSVRCSILRPDNAAGAQTIGDLNFEGVNSTGSAYRVGWMYGKQTQDTAGSERGKITFETIYDGATAERLVIGDKSVADVNVTGTLAVGSGAAISKILTATATLDPPSLNDGEVAAAGVTVTGAAVGDPCFASFSSLPNTNWLISAQVVAADTVRVVIMNKTGGAVDLASGTLRAVVFKF